MFAAAIFFREPGPVLEGKRVLLRLPRNKDYKDWVSLRRQSRAFLEPWEPRWGQEELERSGWRQRQARYRREYARRSAVPFFIFDNQTGSLAGGISIGNIRRGVAQTGQIGYWMGEQFAGRGLMHEALLLVVDYAFVSLQLHRIEAACIPNNERSIRLLEKSGFKREGLLRSYLRINNVWQDHYLYSLIAPGQTGTGQRDRF